MRIYVSFQYLHHDSASEIFSPESSRGYVCNNSSRPSATLSHAYGFSKACAVVLYHSRQCSHSSLRHPRSSRTSGLSSSIEIMMIRAADLSAELMIKRSQNLMRVVTVDFSESLAISRALTVLLCDGPGFLWPCTDLWSRIRQHRRPSFFFQRLRLRPHKIVACSRLCNDTRPSAGRGSSR